MARSALIHPRSLSFLLAFAALGLACAPKKKDKPEYAGVAAHSATLVSFQGKEDPNWLTDVDGNLLTNQDTLSLEGYCSTSTDKVQILVNGTDVGTNPDCAVANRRWTYSGAFTGADGLYNLVIAGKLNDGTVDVANVVVKKINRDKTAPALASFTAPTADPYITNTANVTISGTITGDFESMTASDGAGTFTFNTSAGTFDYQTSMNDNETRTITFTVTDRAGNSSTSTMSRTITYLGAIISMNAPQSKYKVSGLGQTDPMTSNGIVLQTSEQRAIGGSQAVTSSSSGISLTLSSDMSGIISNE